jgi:hypothetical protein
LRAKSPDSFFNKFALRKNKQQQQKKIEKYGSNNVSKVTTLNKSIKNWKSSHLKITY